MKLALLVLLSTFCLAGCSRGLQSEQRLIELPTGAANSTLNTASQIGQGLIGDGFFTAIQRQFPELTEQQFQGVFLSWNEGPVKGHHAVFFLTGIRYRGKVQQARQVANLCEAQVRAGVTNYFETHPQ